MCFHNSSTGVDNRLGQSHMGFLDSGLMFRRCLQRASCSFMALGLESYVGFWYTGVWAFGVSRSGFKVCVLLPHPETKP